MDRRDFLAWSARMSLLLATGAAATKAGSLAAPAGGGEVEAGAERSTLFLAGDVMTGRGIDQVLPQSVDPRLYEPYVKDARRYVELAEEVNGPIDAPLGYEEVWGAALAELDRADPDVRIVNLETAVTTSDEPWPNKGIHYRMHPGNVPLLTTAGIDVCVLGNNHVLDWGRDGLRETLEVLQEAGMATPGAGTDPQEAAAPAVVSTATGRLLVFSYGTPSAGVPPEWEATENQPGVHLLSSPSASRVDEVARHVHAHRRDGDRVVVSLHWGGNWGYDVPASQREFAHGLIDAEAADVVHGHSSHHPKGIEVHGGRPILYGAGDFFNDYEGIGGREEFRAELTLMYFPVMDASGALVSFEMVPMRIRRFRLERASDEDTRWLAERLDRESRRFGARVERSADDRLTLAWD